MRKFNKDRYLKMKLFFNNSKYFYVINYKIESYKFEFDYNGNEQKNTILKSGIYKLEVWGAQGVGALGVEKE